MDALLSCPFCNGKARLEKTLRDGYDLWKDDPDAYAYFCICNSCAAQGGWGKSEGSGIKSWNMRTENRKESA